MIRSFRSRETEHIFEEEFSAKFPTSIQKRVKMCLDRIHAATSPGDLLFFRSMRLEKLSGNRRGQYSVRVSRKYRICFSWIDRYAVKVELTDYH